MKPQFLIDLLNVLKQYDSKDFDKETIEHILSKWVNDGILNKEELIYLTGTPLYNFTADVCGVVRNLRAKKEVKVEVIDFIDTFKESDLMSKVQIADLCGRSKVWVHNNKEHFEDSSKGVNVKSFLRWLKINNHPTYLGFKEKYENL